MDAAFNIEGYTTEVDDPRGFADRRQDRAAIVEAGEDEVEVLR